MSAFDYTARENSFRTLSTVMMGNIPVNKLDLIAVISFYGNTYFNVFRRYNNVYEIVLEDLNGDVFMHKDTTVRQSLQQLLCISDEQINMMYTESLMTFKHNGPIPCIVEVADMRWSEIQENWHGIYVNFIGVLHDYHYGTNSLSHQVASSVLTSDDEAVPDSTQVYTIETEPRCYTTIVNCNCDCNKRTWSAMNEDEVDEELEETEELEEMEELEMEEMEEIEEEEKKEDYESDDYYTILRSGTKLFKKL